MQAVLAIVRGHASPDDVWTLRVMLPSREKEGGIDPDAPVGNWVHWVLFNLPASLRELPAGVPATKTLDQGGRQGKNDFKKTGYGGPCPPAGEEHRYLITVHYLGEASGLNDGDSGDDMVARLRTTSIASAEVTGTFSRAS